MIILIVRIGNLGLRIGTFLFIIAHIELKNSKWTPDLQSSNLVVARSTRAGGAILVLNDFPSNLSINQASCVHYLY